MFDIDFYMKANDIRKRIATGESIDRGYIANQFNSFRNKQPIIYNIETTNACNMKCTMCPRTTMMTRKIETIHKDLFVKIIEQITPFSVEQWDKWKMFVQKEYGIQEDEMSENHFFLYIIPKIIQLHGYGDPLLDKNMPYYVDLLHKNGFCSYFSCNPININIDKTREMMDNGLDYIKYSIESINDIQHKLIRGKESDFTHSFNNIKKILDIKQKGKYNTTVIITMLDLHRPNQANEFKWLKEAFSSLNVYIYFKSEDQQWYRKDYHGTQSIHWSEFCKHPWMSMTIKSNGEVAMCMEDFNNEIVLGNANNESLHDIWNGEKYRIFRENHINNAINFKCNEKCDMKLIGGI